MYARTAYNRTVYVTVTGAQNRYIYVSRIKLINLLDACTYNRPTESVLMKSGMKLLIEQLENLINI